MSTETPQEAPTPAQGPNLTIADLVLTAQIIQAGAAKGIYRAEELKTVGDFYDRLVAFLEASGAITRGQPAQPPAPETAEQTQEKPNAKTRRKA
jgi:hypothetical protein